MLDTGRPLVTRRRIAWLIALVVLLTLGSLGVVAFTFLPEIVRRAAVYRLESFTHRRVEIDRVAVNLLTGHVVVHGLRVAEREGPGTLAKVDRIEGHIRRRSLWTLRVWIQDLSIAGAVIRVTRLSPTRFNISDLLERPAEPRA